MTRQRLQATVVRTTLVWFVALAIGSCGGAPTAPGGSGSAPSFELQVGLQLFEIIGFNISSDPQFPPCSFPLPAGGTYVATAVLLQREGNGWVARSAPPAVANIEIRFGDARVVSMGRPTVSGTISGSAADLAYGAGQHTAHDVRVSFAGGGGMSATFQGTVSGNSFLTGQVTGGSTFTDSQGVASECAAVLWTLQPARGAF